MSSEKTDKTKKEKSTHMENSLELFYYENGMMVMTEAYHLNRGHCCGNQCRHCPYDHENVPHKS